MNDSRGDFVFFEFGFASSTKIRFKARTNEWNAAKSKSTSLSHMTCLGAALALGHAGHTLTAVEKRGRGYRLNNKRSPIIPEQSTPQAIPPKAQNSGISKHEPVGWMLTAGYVFRSMLENYGKNLR